MIKEKLVTRAHMEEADSFTSELSEEEIKMHSRREKKRKIDPFSISFRKLIENRPGADDTLLDRRSLRKRGKMRNNIILYKNKKRTLKQESRESDDN